VEDRRVIAANRRQHEIEDLLVRRREVDVAAPDPARLGPREVVDHPDGLGIVNDDEVVVVLEFGCVELLIAPEDLALFLVEPLRVPLQGVMDRLRDVVELLGAGDDAPLDLEARVLHQGNERVVDLGNAAAECRRRQVHDTLSCKRLGKPADFVHQSPRRDGRVIRKGLMSDVDELEHGLGALG
jgi:hypothetical protein